jgi:hypothetical protein
MHIQPAFHARVTSVSCHGQVAAWAHGSLGWAGAVDLEDWPCAFGCDDTTEAWNNNGPSNGSDRIHEHERRNAFALATLVRGVVFTLAAATRQVQPPTTRSYSRAILALGA